MKDIPAFKFLVYMIAGITFSYLFKFYDISFYYLFPVSITVIISLYFMKLKEIAYIIACIFTGIAVTININNQQIKVPGKLIPEQNAVFIGGISSVNRLDSNYAKIIINGTLDTKVLPKLENQSITLNIYNIDEIKVKLIPGTKIYAKLKVRLPRPKIFPTDFDEQQFYSSSEINFIGKANAKDISLIDGPNLFQYSIYKFTNELKHRIDVIFGSNNSGIIKALLTGDQTQINADIRQNFSVTGTVHVLSVGGLHVGLISIGIFLLLGFISNRWIKFVIFSILIYLFIVITGYQASALRAGLMAILLFLASNMERKTNPINIISCVSIFIILFDNAIILSPSFQMSITSVLGILLLYKPIYEKFQLFIKTDNSIINFILTSFSVSISASVIVSPIVAYYFGVYSIISPVANLFVIPLFSLASYLSILALLFSQINIDLGVIFGNSANYLIDVSNYINEISAATNLSFISGNNTFLISFFISISIIYISITQSTRLFVFRMTISIIIVVSIYLLFKTESIERIGVYPKDKYVIVHFPNIKNKDILCIFDRKPGLKPYLDYSLMKFSTNFKRDLIIAHAGNYGIMLNDTLKKIKNVNEIRLNHDFGKYLTKKLNLQENIVQKISY